MNLAKSAALVAAVAGVAAAANAQGIAPPTRPFAVKLGVYLPTDSKAKKAGDVQFAFGLNYDVFKTPTPLPVVISGFVDGAFASKSGHERRVISVGPAARIYFAPAVQPVNFYAGAGVSVNFLHGKDEGDSQSNTRLGGKIFAGAEFKEGFLGEVSYDFPGNIRGGSYNGVGLKLGFRF